jgi:hypothetical protein
MPLTVTCSDTCLRAEFELHFNGHRAARHLAGFGFPAGRFFCFSPFFGGFHLAGFRFACFVFPFARFHPDAEFAVAVSAPGENLAVFEQRA